MKISFRSQNFYNYKRPYPIQANGVDFVSQNENSSGLELPDYETCRAYVSKLQSNNAFLYSRFHAIKLQHLFEDDNCEFSLPRAASFIKDLADKQLMLYSSKDIQTSVEQVMASHPDTSREQVLKTMAKLSNFSNYDSLDAVQSYLKDKNILTLYPTDKITVNNIFQYFIGKNYLKFEPSDYAKGACALFVDRNTIEYLKELKKNHPHEINAMKTNIQNGKMKLVLLDGWEAKTNDGYRSFNIVGKWGDLTEAVSSIIETEKSMPQTKSVFNDDIIKDINSIFEDDMPVDIISNDSEKIDEQEIANRLNAKTLKIEDIESSIQNSAEIAYSKNMSNSTKEEIQKMISFIFALTNNAYSPRRLAKELKDLDKKINDRAFYYDKPKENLMFIIPSKEKSFGLINYQYSKVNDIPLSKYIYVDKNNLSVDEDKKKNKVFVLCDDFSGSGHSMLFERFPYARFKFENKEQPFIFAPLVYTKRAIKAIEKEISTVQGSKFLKDSAVGGNYAHGLGDFIHFLSFSKQGFFQNHYDSGFLEGGLCLSFPHVIPDNCMEIAGELFEPTLRNPKANKSTRSII